MRHVANETQNELLIQLVETMASQLGGFAALLRANQDQRKTAFQKARMLVSHIREVLSNLAIASESDANAAVAGAGFLCTAVQFAESLFAPNERADWFQAFASRVDCFTDTTLRGKLLGNYGNALAEVNRLDEAEIVLARRLQLARDENDSMGVAFGQEHLGKLLLRRGRSKEAEPLLEAAYLSAEERGDATAVTRLLTDRANACFRRGDATEGIRLLEDRLRRCEQQNEVMLELSTRHTLADRLTHAGRLDEARRHAEQVADIASRLRLPARRAAALGTLGDIAFDQEKLDEAKRHVSAARKIFRRLGNLTMQGNTATSLGLITRKMGDLKRAANWFREAIDIDKSTGRKGDEATDLGNLAATLILMRDFSGAIELYQQRLTILETLRQDRRAAETRFSLAEIFAGQSRYDDAIGLAEQALQFMVKIDPQRAADIETPLQIWRRKIDQTEIQAPRDPASSF